MKQLRIVSVPYTPEYGADEHNLCRIAVTEHALSRLENFVEGISSLSSDSQCLRDIFDVSLWAFGEIESFNKLTIPLRPGDIYHPDQVARDEGEEEDVEDCDEQSCENDIEMPLCHLTFFDTENQRDRMKNTLVSWEWSPKHADNCDCSTPGLSLMVLRELFDKYAVEV